MDGSRIVIVGAGQAGAWAARTLRAEGYQGRIVLCGDEGEPPYERPPLSKEQLVPEPQPMPHLIGVDEMTALKIEWRGAAAARHIGRQTRTVELADGSSIPYDKLIICTGGRAVLPPIPGVGLSCVHTLRTLADARRLRAHLRQDARVLVIGGGWIGLEVAASAHGLGCAVIVVEAGPRLCGRTSVEIVSDFLARLHRSNGVEVRLGTTVMELRATRGEGCVVKLSDGAALEADVVVVGVGMVPNDALAQDAGLACDRGIIVESGCRTSDPAIFAAGDVTALRGADGVLRRLESWQNAQDQGKAAARAALSQDVDYRPLPFMWSQQFNVLLQLTGTFGQGQTTAIHTMSEEKFIYVELDEQSIPTAAVCANVPRDFRQIRAFIQGRQVLDRGRVNDPHVRVGLWPAHDG